MAPVMAALAWVATSQMVAAMIIRTILINVILGALVKAMSPEAKQYAPPVNVTVRSTTENRRLILGTARAGGVFAFYGVSSNSGTVLDPNLTNKYLFYVIALAGHQVNAIKDVWIDKVRISSTNINLSTGVVTGTVFGTKLSIWGFLGTSSQAAASIMTGAFSASWTSAMQLKGIAYIVLRMERDDTAFPNGAPQNVTALVDGAKLYDPRLDSTNGGSGSHRVTDATTWAFSHNSILAARWLITGGSVTNDVATPFVMYGLRELTSRVDDAFVIASANHCDESLTGANTTPDGDQVRYQCDIELSTGETRRASIDAIMTTCAGRAVYSHGKWQLSAGVYDAPLYAFTEADLYGDIEIQDTTTHSDRYNAVAGVYRDQAQQYIETTTPFRVDSSFDTQDGGERIPREIDLRGVRDRYRAQRLCEIEKRKSRQMRTIKMIGALNLLKIAPGDTFTLSYTRFSWSSRVFRCLEKSFDFVQEAGRVVITARAEASSVYTDMVTADYITPLEVVPLVSYETPDPPQSLITVPITNGILIKWTASITPGVTYELEESTAYAMTSPTVIYAGADAQAVIDKVVTTTYYYRVRAKKNGLYSSYAPTSNGVSGASLGAGAALAASVSPGSVSGSGSGTSQTTGAAVVTASGGTPAYTYAWTWFSGGASITTTSPTSASTTFSTTGLAAGSTVSGVARCTVTDSLLATKTVDVNVSITNGAPLSVTASPTYLSKSKFDHVGGTLTVSTAACTATAAGGTLSGYAYAWTWLSGGSGMTINSASSAATTFSGTSMTQSDSRSGTARCTVTDSGSHVATVDVNVDIYRESDL